MKIEKLNAARKRGADMTQALLYAAFAIVVLISVLAMYQVVTLNSNKTTAARTVSTAAQEARTLFRNSADFTGLNKTVLIQAGAVPTDAIDNNGTDADVSDDTIILPYQGTVDFAVNGTDSSKFNAVVDFAANTRGARALCTFLASGVSAGSTAGVITGPMGAEYSSAAAIPCTDATAGFTVTYER